MNPAITIAFYSCGLIAPLKALAYIIAQLAGEIIGAVFADIVTPGPLSTYKKVSPVFYIGAAFLSEVILTFVLVITVFTSMIKSPMNAGFGPTMIGLSVFVIHLAGITIDGVSGNHARFFGPSVVANMWDDHWIFWTGPIVSFK